MSVAAPLVDLTGLDLPPSDSLWESSTPATGVAWRRRLLHLARPDEIKILALVAFCAYVVMGFYLHYHLHFWINDELNRTTDAVYTAIGRDPHLGAIGFYWPPLAQLLEIPAVVVLNVVHQTIMAGPVTSAACIAATIPVLSSIARMLGLGRPTTLLFVLTFAVNPVVVYYAANGMSEACFFLSGAVMLWGFLAYIRDRSIPSIALFTLGMSAMAMTRLEGPFVAVVMTFVAACNLRDIRRSLWEMAILIAPPAFFFAFWIAVQYVLVHDPLFFEHQAGGGAPPTPGHAVWLPNTAADPLAAIPWAFHWVWVLGPALAIVAATVWFQPRSGRVRGSIGVMAGMGVFLLIQIDQVITGTGYGDPRYFVTAILFATVGALWIASRARRWWSPAWNLSLIAVLLASGATGTWELTSARITHVEHECVFFEDFVARYVPALGRQPVSANTCPIPYDGLRPWVQATEWLDHRLTPKDRVLTDNSEIPQPDLLSRHSDQYVVQNDDDWHKTVSNPYFVTYVITEAQSANAGPDTTTDDQGANIVTGDSAHWKLLGTWGPAYTINHGTAWVKIYHYQGPARSGTATFGQ